MKRICFLILLAGGFILPLHAAHIRGGELSYKYEGPGTTAGTSVYTLTVKLYIDCGQNDPGQLDIQTALTIFTKPDNQQYGQPLIAPMVKEEFIQYDPNSNPCITNPPRDVCYRLRYYSIKTTLKDTPEGYTIGFQRCCRIEGIKNVQAPSNDVGATYWCEIPGTNALPDAPKNTSPVFVAKDAVAICIKSDFVFDFSANDPDGDSLVYHLCEGYVGGGPGNGTSCLSCPVPNPGAPPPYRPLSYQFPFSGSFPLGPNVHIDTHTGLLSGTAPSQLGQYVVTVCVSEYRRGVLINIHRKDIHIKVSDCAPLKAELNPDYSYCDDFNVTFKNEQINPTGSVYTWDFGDGTIDTSLIPDGTIPHKYADTGTYRVKVKVVLAGHCEDSTFTNAHVYPGFFPGFSYDGSCLFAPFIFTDTTKTRYGFVSFWKWDFGDETTDGDSSQSKDTSWLYHSLGFKTVSLVVGSDKGCLDSFAQVIVVKDKPTIDVAFKDTLICVPDSVQLHAIGDGTFVWTPTTNMINSSTADPTVYPRTTTNYYVTMTQDRCVATDTVQVRVVDHVTLFAGNDTTICRTDTIQLHPQSDGLKFVWTSSPSARYINEPTTEDPFTAPFVQTTVYTVVASIGSCVATDELNVITVPYPQANAGSDTTICYDDTTQINASTNGSRFYWIPVVNLINPNTLRPLAYPLETTTYTLYAFDTLGCPKPSTDQVIVTVRPEIITNAGNDTSVVRGQPLQLHATGADLFAWEPETGLNKTSIPDPIAVLDENITYIIKSYTEEGCFDYDTLNIRVFKTAPDIFVPNAFVPTGKNNILKPKPVGIAKLDYFRVFNRWGQLVFQTTELEKGWDGRVNGQLQNNDTYVWMVSGTDYTGRKVIRKGTAVLIR